MAIKKKWREIKDSLPAYKDMSAHDREALDALTDEDEAILALEDGEISDGSGACKICGGTGRLLSPRAPDPFFPGVALPDLAKLCECSWRRIYERKFESANVPRPFWTMTLDNWNLRQDAYGDDLSPNDEKKKIWAHKFMSRYLKVVPDVCRGRFITIKPKDVGMNLRIQNLTLVGGRKSGKTLFAALVMMEAIRRGFTAYFFDWSDLWRVFTSFDKRSEQDVAISLFESVDLVVIDGVKNYDQKISSGYFEVGIDLLSNARMHNSRPTIVTSSDDPKNIAGASDGWRRMLEESYYIDLPSSIKSR